MERDPHSMIEGMIIAGYALGAASGYVYTAGEYRYLIDIMDVALAECREAGLLGKNIFGSGFDHIFIPIPERGHTFAVRKHRC